MKAVLLAGGRGTRMGEFTQWRPKPMAMVNGKPLIMHIIDHYRGYGVKEFIVCAGYKAQALETIAGNGITVIDTGLNTPPMERLRLVKHHIDGRFFMTYADTVSDVDVWAGLGFHDKHGKIATMTVAPFTERFGVARLSSYDFVLDYRERTTQWANRGFFVLEPHVLGYAGDELPLAELAQERQLMAYRHDGFFHSVDTVDDLAALEAHYAGRGDSGVRVLHSADQRHPASVGGSGYVARGAGLYREE